MEVEDIKGEVEILAALRISECGILRMSPDRIYGIRCELKWFGDDALQVIESLIYLEPIF